MQETLTNRRPDRNGYWVELDMVVPMDVEEREVQEWWGELVQKMLSGKAHDVRTPMWADTNSERWIAMAGDKAFGSSQVNMWCLSSAAA